MTAVRQRRSHTAGRALRLALAAVLALLSVSGELRAGRGDKSGTAAASELLIPVGARSIALGGAVLSTVNGAEAMYWNPAGMALSFRPGFAMASHMSYLGDIGVNYFAAAGSFGDVGILGVSVKSLSVGDIAVTTEDQPDGTGETASPTFLVVGGSFARKISERIAVGLTANLIFERMARVSANGVAFNGGVEYTQLGGVEGLSFGAVVKNLGPPIRYGGAGLLRTAQVNDALRQNSEIAVEAAAADLPSTIEIGLGYTAGLQGSSRLHIMTAFQNNNFSEDEYRLGAEYRYQEFLALRAGYTMAQEDEGHEYIFGPSFGLGLHSTVETIDVTIDYAYRSVRYFDGNHVISLIVGF